MCICTINELHIYINAVNLYFMYYSAQRIHPPKAALQVSPRLGIFFQETAAVERPKAFQGSTATAS